MKSRLRRYSPLIVAFACASITNGQVHQSRCTIGTTGRTADAPMRRGSQQGEILWPDNSRSISIEWSPTRGIDLPSLERFRSDWTIDVARPETFRCASQTIEANFHVSAVATLDSERLLVTGTTDDDRVVFERWTFAWPDVMPETVVGEERVAIVEPRLAAVQRIASEGGIERFKVAHAVPMPSQDHAPARVLLELEFQPELWAIELQSGVVSPVASGLTHLGSLGFVPELNEANYTNLSVRDRGDFGCAYVLTRKSIGCVITEDAFESLVFIDADRDGTLDAWRRLDRAEFLRQGWRSPEFDLVR